jgi:hypothetical protein
VGVAQKVLADLHQPGNNLTENQRIGLAMQKLMAPPYSMPARAARAAIAQATQGGGAGGNAPLTASR